MSKTNGFGCYENCRNWGWSVDDVTKDSNLLYFLSRLYIIILFDSVLQAKKRKKTKIFCHKKKTREKETTTLRLFVGTFNFDVAFPTSPRQRRHPPFKSFLIGFEFKSRLNIVTTFQYERFFPSLPFLLWIGVIELLLFHQYGFLVRAGTRRAISYSWHTCVALSHTICKRKIIVQKINK